MKKFMMIGKIGCGKTTLSQQLHGLDIRYKKTQAVEIVGDSIIDTPGEYLERKEFYKALIVTAVEADVILLLCDCRDDTCTFSPGMNAMFQKEMIGVVTKVDLCDDPAQLRRAKQMLEFAGAGKLFEVSGTTGTGVRELKQYLES